MAGHTEHDFETAIEAGLIGTGGYVKRPPTDYDELLALFPGDVTSFLKDSQATKWAQLQALLGTKTEATVLDSLAKELEVKGRHRGRLPVGEWNATVATARYAAARQHG